ncbi:hypothetical protein LCGC14_0174690 [marine sediment metagenome]|uniref:Uncharacterized protein n=1 Tax=marine sediment metagenome TaxID=412755 RepID=A0A0F9UR29_9ZZZZ
MDPEEKTKKTETNKKLKKEESESEITSFTWKMPDHHRDR